MSGTRRSSRLRAKNWAIAAALIAFVVLVYLITLVKLSSETG